MRSSKIEFYFDPHCPFCWIASRWLLMVEPERDLKITWRPFSLAIKNDELDGQNRSNESEGHRSSHRILRVMAAAEDQGASMVGLYNDFGLSFHLGKHQFDDELIVETLARHELPADLLAAADDKAYDAALAQSVDDAVKVAGQKIGTPTVIFRLDDGTKAGYFGPVLQSLPELRDGLDLWDGLSKLALNKEFYELKRQRPAGDPNIASTKQA